VSPPTGEESAVRPARLLTHTGIYFSSQVLLVVASLIAMPITTRLLPTDQYGLLSLVLASVSLLSIAGTAGFGETTLRLYAERRRRGAAALRSFCEAMLGGALVTSLVVASCVLVAAAWWGAEQPEYARCLRLAAALTVLNVGAGIARQIFRCQGRPLAYAASEVGGRFLTVVLSVVILVFFERTAVGAILAVTLGAAALFGARLADLWANGTVGRPRLSLSAFAVATRYGLPLSIAAASNFLLSFGDRFLIGRLLGLDAVASYSIPYDLADRFVEVLLTPIGLAVMPAFYESWAGAGREATSEFASRLLTSLLAIVIPLSALFLYFGDSVVTLLASERYAPAAALIPYLLPGLLLCGLNFIVVAGLTVEKRSVRVAAHVLGVAALNLVLNVLLIPRFGLPGAAVATTVAYAVLVAANFFAGRATLRLRPDWRIIAKATGAALLVVVVLRWIGPISSLRPLDLGVRGPFGAALAFASLWAIEPELRRSARLVWNR